MTITSMTVDREQFRKQIAFCMELARDYYASIGNDMIPSLLVCVDTRSADWSAELVLMPEFGEDRYKVLTALGFDYGSAGKMVPAIVLTAEAWSSIQTVAEREAHPENRVRPSDDPERKEVLIINGMTLDLHSEMMRAEISRDDAGKATLGAIQTMVDYENAIAMSFWRGYAVGFLGNKMGGQS